MIIQRICFYIVILIVSVIFIAAPAISEDSSPTGIFKANTNETRSLNVISVTSKVRLGPGKISDELRQAIQGSEAPFSVIQNNHALPDTFNIKEVQRKREDGTTYRQFYVLENGFYVYKNQTGYFKNGRQNGLLLKYYRCYQDFDEKCKNINIESSKAYKDGYQHGWTTYYSRKGKVTRRIRFENGKEVEWTSINRNNVIHSVYYDKEENNIRVDVYTDGGPLKTEVRKIDGGFKTTEIVNDIKTKETITLHLGANTFDKEIMMFYPTGGLRCHRINSRNTTEPDSETCYYENGRKKEEVEYKDGNRVGISIHYDEAGVKIHQENHDPIPETTTVTEPQKDTKLVHKKSFFHAIMEHKKFILGIILFLTTLQGIDFIVQRFRS